MHITREKVQQLRRQHSSTQLEAVASSVNVVPHANDKPRYSASGRRQLLQTTSPSSGITVTVSVYSKTAEEQNTMTSLVNTSHIEQLGFSTVSEPFGVMSDVESSVDPVGTISGGFQVVRVQYNDTDSR